eukprot:EG_transcript_42330
MFSAMISGHSQGPHFNEWLVRKPLVNQTSHLTAEGATKDNHQPNDFARIYGQQFLNHSKKGDFSQQPQTTAKAEGGRVWGGESAGSKSKVAMDLHPSSAELQPKFQTNVWAGIW